MIKNKKLYIKINFKTCLKLKNLKYFKFQKNIYFIKHHKIILKK